MKEDDRLVYDQRNKQLISPVGGTRLSVLQPALLKLVAHCRNRSFRSRDPARRAEKSRLFRFNDVPPAKLNGFL